MKLKKIVVEMLFVGITLSLLGLIVGYGMNLFKKGQIDWWPKHVWSMLIGTMITGALFHLICEVVGINKWYVKQYKPIF